MSHLDSANAKFSTICNERITAWYTVKKGYIFSRPQPGCHKPNSPWQGIIKLFPVRESLVSNIPAGDGKTITLFYSVADVTDDTLS